MNELIQNSFNALTMSSREITALTGKKHYNVKRDIELLAAQLEVDVSKFGGIYTDSQNREQAEYLLDKDTCLCLVAGYNAKLRMKIIKRWQELEQGKTKLLLAEIEALKAHVAEIEAHELTKTLLSGKKKLAKEDNGKSTLGASIKQVNQALNSTYTWQPLKKYCEENHMELEYIFPYSYGSLAVAVYPYNAWLNVYEIDLNQIFGERYE